MVKADTSWYRKPYQTGLNAYDLYLLGQHILYIKPFTDVHSLVAADVNRSQTISTADIVAIRQLILGQTDTLPVDRSWIWVPLAYTLNHHERMVGIPDPMLSDSLMSIHFPGNIGFVGVKMGNVSGFYAPDKRPSPKPLPLAISLPAARKNSDMISVPVYYKGDQTLEAYQLGLKFDPEALQLIGPSKGDLNGYDPGLFNLSNAAQGEIRALWYPVGDPSEAGNSITPDAVLFYLHFKVLKSAGLSENIFQLDASGMECLAWKGSGEEFSWELQAETAARTMPAAQFENAVLSAKWQPNPTVGTQSAFLVVQSREAGPARLYLTDASGKPIVIQDINMESGENKFEVPAMSTLPAGVYGWKLRLRKSRTDVSGTVIKQ